MALSDDTFDAIADIAINVSVTNDDTPGVTLSTSTVTVSEDGTLTAEFTVVLDSEPTSAVVIDVASDDSQVATIDATGFTFTAAGWDQPRTVTVTGVDDDFDDDGRVR